MSEVPPEFCGYEWPKDCERYDYDDDCALVDEGDSHQQTTCIREALPDTDRCAWHAVSGETEYKSIKTLQDARIPTKIRAESNLKESLDGAVLTRMELEDELDLSGIRSRGADFSRANLQHASFSRANLRDANLSDADLLCANLRYANLSGADLRNASLGKADFTRSDLSAVDLSSADLAGSTMLRTNVSGGKLIDTSLSDAFLLYADFSQADLSEAGFSKADLSGADFCGASLSDADFTNSNLSETNLTSTDIRDVSLLNADLANATIADLTINSATSVGGFAEQSTAEGWVKLAGAYHDLKLEYHNAGFIRKARSLHISERRARRRETAAEVGWFSRQHLTQFVSGLFTGYGVGVWRLVGTMALLFIISTITYALTGKVTDPLTYSTITFVTAPPGGADNLPLWARFVANIETFFGTLLIVSLGFVLGNREQF